RALRAVLLWTWRGLREVAAWPRRAAAWSRRPTGRLVVPSTLVLTLLAGSAVAGAVVVPKPLTGKAVPTGSGVAPPRPPEVAPIVPPTLPGLDPSPDPPLERPSDVLRGWAQQMSVRTGIPAVALPAYGYAALGVAQAPPRRWNARPTSCAAGPSRCPCAPASRRSRCRRTGTPSWWSPRPRPDAA